MNLQRVPVSQIRVPEVRVTAVYDEETQARLRETVARLGVLSPIIVVKTEKGYDLVDGLHRVEEERRLGKTEVDAVVYEGDEADSLLLNLILNKTRGKVKASEMVAVIGELYAKHGIGIEAIEEKTGLSRNYVEKLIRIYQAAPSIQEALDQEVLGVGVAYEIARLPTRVQQDAVVGMQGLWRLPVKDVKKLVDDTVRMMEEIPTEQPTGRKVVLPQYFCHTCKREHPFADLRAVYMCMDCFSASWLATAERREGEKVTAPDVERGGGA